MLRPNIILMTDSYKMSHAYQYPPGAEFVSSYIESRGGKWDFTVFYGLQIYLRFLEENPLTLSMINEAEAVCSAHGVPFNREGWMHILNEHNGRLPIQIEALPEGTVVDGSNALVQLQNTDPAVPWLTSYIETSLLRAVWYPTTVATNSFVAKQAIWDALVESADAPEMEIDFKMHDFGARGVSSSESAGIGGSAHLVNFKGTDTIEGILYAREFYGENMAGFSIPAAEHSTITSWGGPEHEVEAFDNMLDQFAKPGAIVAVVSDSYDIYNACSNLWGDKLKQKVIDSGATIVVRPDSGDPTVVPIQCIELLMEKFGFEVNSKGYKVLPSREDGSPIVRVIQGDGITADTIKVILDNMLERDLSASNIAFGQGGGLLQQIDRDTLKFAMKASAIKVKGFWKDVFKDPKTDPGKVSKKGRLGVKITSGLGGESYQTVRRDYCQPSENLLKVVFKNGQIKRTTNFAEVRERAQKGLLVRAANKIARDDETRAEDVYGDSAHAKLAS